MAPDGGRCVGGAQLGRVSPGPPWRLRLRGRTRWHYAQRRTRAQAPKLRAAPAPTAIGRHSSNRNGVWSGLEYTGNFSRALCPRLSRAGPFWTLEGESSRHPSVPTGPGSHISKNRVLWTFGLWRLKVQDTHWSRQAAAATRTEWGKAGLNPRRV